MSRLKRAQIYADAVSVLCPNCAEPQPNHEGSEMWIRQDFEKKSGEFACVSCDSRLLITADPKAVFQ